MNLQIPTVKNGGYATAAANWRVEQKHVRHWRQRWCASFYRSCFGDAERRLEITQH
ncbi:MAG: hypothetical protein WAK55_00730 [Xanthobacteraceae bacterium]